MTTKITLFHGTFAEILDGNGKRVVRIEIEPGEEELVTKWLEAHGIKVTSRRYRG